MTGDDPGALTGAMVTEAASQGDPVALAAFAEVGDWLGVGLANLVAAFDPALLVVGGGVSAAGRLLLDPARAALARSLVGAADRVVPSIAPAALGPEAGMIGAAWLARQMVSSARKSALRRRGHRLNTGPSAAHALLHDERASASERVEEEGGVTGAADRRAERALEHGAVIEGIPRAAGHLGDQVAEPAQEARR